MLSPAISGARALRTPKGSRSVDISKRQFRESSPLLPSANGPKTQTKTPVDITKIVQCIVYGTVNSILTIPCMYGYAAIIYSHPDFSSFMPSLAKLVLFSSVVHQVVFSSLSTLPFAIGQVQDAGLIFLCAIATSICNSMGEESPLESKVATTIVTISIGTALLGLVLVTLGKFRLAKLVSYLPMPVVGGYLAFIGLFCLFAGLSLCTGLQINSFASLTKLWNLKSFVLMTPGILAGFGLLLISKYCQHPAALPTALISIPLLFFIALAASGYSLDDAREYGWVGKSSPTVSFPEVWTLFKFEQVDWTQIPRQFSTWAGMTFVVAFSSCLDVAAIEMDMGNQLNINHELKTVGWSNLVSGLFGGYTGSYIFSQTIFTYRTNTNNRLVGMMVIICEFLICLLPLDIMSFLPLFFFASTLIFIAVDLMIEWLITVWWHILIQDYIVLVLTFIAINCVSLELGMFIGVGFAVLNFLFGYSQVKVVKRVPKRSSTIRTFAKRSILAKERDSIVCLELHGFLFFGSSIRILEDVQKQVKILKTTDEEDTSEPSPFSLNSHKRKHEQDGNNRQPNKKFHPLNAEMDLYVNGRTIQKRSKSFDTYGHGYGAGLEFKNNSHSKDGGGDTPALQYMCGGEVDQSDHTLRKTKFVVLDFKHVTGMDATAARSCFLILEQMFSTNNITMIYASLLPEIEKLLRQNEILPSLEEEETKNGTQRVFKSVDNAMEICEDILVERAVSGRTPRGRRVPRLQTGPGMSLSSLLNNFLGNSTPSMSKFINIETYFSFLEVPKGYMFYSLDEESNDMYILSSGNITLQLPIHGIVKKGAATRLLEHVRPGGLFGEVDFFANQNREMAAVAEEKSVVFRLNRREYIKMENEDPQLFKAFRDLIIRSMCLTISNCNWLIET